MALWLYGFMALWLYGFMADQKASVQPAANTAAIQTAPLLPQNLITYNLQAGADNFKIF